MFIELDEPMFFNHIDGGKRWFITSVELDGMNYLHPDKNLHGIPYLYETIDEAWTVASEYCTSYNMVYPYALSSDGVIIKIGEKTISKIREWGEKILQGDSRVMEFEE